MKVRIVTAKGAIRELDDVESLAIFHEGVYVEISPATMAENRLFVCGNLDSALTVHPRSLRSFQLGAEVAR